jgi:hypothetical protein
MSYDLEIATSQKPKQEHLTEFLSTQRKLSADGELGAEQMVLVNRHTRTGVADSFTIGGPYKVDIDDLSELLTAAVLGPRWLVQIWIPYGSSKATFAIARALAKHIAKRCQGGVYDPQSDSMIWPRGKPKRYKAPAEKQRIRLVELKWFLPAYQSSRRTAKLFLESLRNFCPEASPTRFGTYEPLQGRLEPGEIEPFMKMWNEQSAITFGGDFFFKSRSPCYGGFIHFPDRRDVHKPKRAGRAVSMSLSFDGRALHGDARWCETVVLLFVKLSERLEAFYATGFVERGVIAGRGGVGYDAKSETTPLPRGTWWFGVPSNPTWLAWFGKPYMTLVEKSLNTQLSERTSSGIFLRMGREPMDIDQLRGVFPRLPSRVLAKMDEEKMGIPAEFIPNLE